MISGYWFKHSIVIFAKILGTLAANLQNVAIGIMIGFVTISLPNLGELNSNEASWFASIDLFSIMIFAPLGGTLSNWLGRKKTMIILSPIASFGWILLADSSSKYLLFAGRSLSSIAQSLMLASQSM